MRFRTADDCAIETAAQASATTADRMMGKSGPPGRAITTRPAMTVVYRTAGVADGTAAIISG